MVSALRLPSLCLVFVLLWSSGWIGSKYLLNYADALGALAWRYLLVVAVLIMLVSALRLWRAITMRELWHQASIGILSHTGFLAFSVASMQYGVNAGMVAFITALQPVFTMVIAYPVLQERISLRQLAGIVLGAASVVIIVSEKITHGGSILTYSLPFMSVISLTIASVFCRYSERRHVGVARPATPLLLILLIQCSVASVGFCLLAWKFGSFSVMLELGFFISLAYMSIVVSIASFFMYFLLLRELSAVKAASLVYLTPPVTMVLGWIWFRENLSFADLVGLLVAFIAVLMITVKVETVRTRKSPVAVSLGRRRVIPGK